MNKINVYSQIARRQWAQTCMAQRLNTRVVPDKTKYSRKDKYRKSYDS
jgi:hypothetical protein